MKTEKREVSISGFSYRHFGWMGRFMGRLFYSNNRAGLEQALEDAGLRMYPEAYFSIFGFLLIISIILTVPLVLFTGFVFLAQRPF